MSPVAENGKPLLLVFYSATSGASRRVDGFLAQVLQRRRNHETFNLRRLEYEAQQELAQKLGVKLAPTLVVVEGKQLRARLENPTGAAEIRTALEPWLQ